MSDIRTTDSTTFIIRNPRKITMQGLFTTSTAVFCVRMLCDVFPASRVKKVTTFPISTLSIGSFFSLINIKAFAILADQKHPGKFGEFNHIPAHQELQAKKEKAYQKGNFNKTTRYERELLEFKWDYDKKNLHITLPDHLLKLIGEEPAKECTTLKKVKRRS